MKALLQKIASAVQALLKTGRTARAWKQRNANAGGTRRDHFDNLLLKAMGDHSQVERLINYELRRSLNLSRAEAIQRANDRWERDLMS